MSIQNAIFIGGCSRSGTTLLGSMIGGHPQTISTPESHFKRGVLVGEPYPPPIEATYNRIKAHWRFKVWDITPPDLPPHIETYTDLLYWLVELYAQANTGTSITTWVDHTPENITYAHLLLDIFPTAKLIHLVRDGRAVAASIIPLDWGPNTIEFAARWWLESVSYGLALETHLPSERIMRVTYEDLVLYPAETTRKLCDFTGLTFDPVMLSGTGFKVPDYTANQHELVGQEPDPSRVTGWKRKLTPRQIEIFEAITRDYLKSLGYTLEYGLNAVGPSPLELAKMYLQEGYRGLFSNRVRWLRRGGKVFLKS